MLCRADMKWFPVTSEEQQYNEKIRDLWSINKVIQLAVLDHLPRNRVFFIIFIRRPRPDRKSNNSQSSHYVFLSFFLGNLLWPFADDKLVTPRRRLWMREKEKRTICITATIPLSLENIRAETVRD